MCQFSERINYTPWILTNKGEEPEQIGYIRTDEKFVYYYDNDLNLIKKKAR